MPQFFKAIYDAAVGVKPDALVEICPCGTAYSFKAPDDCAEAWVGEAIRGVPREPRSLVSSTC